MTDKTSLQALMLRRLSLEFGVDVAPAEGLVGAALDAPRAPSPARFGRDRAAGSCARCTSSGAGAASGSGSSKIPARADDFLAITLPRLVAYSHNRLVA